MSRLKLQVLMNRFRKATSNAQLTQARLDNVAANFRKSTRETQLAVFQDNIKARDTLYHIERELLLLLIAEKEYDFLSINYCGLASYLMGKE